MRRACLSRGRAKDLGEAGMRYASTIIRAILTLGMITCASVSGFAQTAQEFYKSHQITLIISSGAGGGYDAYSRMLARFLGRHIPSEPRIIVQNMEGADGLTAINYVTNVAPRDGSVISDTFSTMPFYMLIDGRNAKFDAQKINWLGSISKALSVCIAWHDSSFKTFDDALQRSMRVSGTGATGWRAVLPHLLNAVAETKFDVITGYATPADYLAIERGEVDGSCTTYDTLLASKIDWLKQKKIVFLAQFGLEPTPELPDVPMGLDRVKNPDDRAAMQLILAQQETGRPYLAPPDVPADRVHALQAAFDATMRDPDFIATAQQANLWLQPMAAEQMRSVIEKAYATPPAIVSRAKSLLQQAVVK
jgi:tripartite-type tricarboxylate transporter receptor subunit TctC